MGVNNKSDDSNLKLRLTSEGTCRIILPREQMELQALSVIHPAPGQAAAIKMCESRPTSTPPSLAGEAGPP